MEDQSGQAQGEMADQGFRNWLTEELNAQQHAGSSSIPELMQVLAPPSLTCDCGAERSVTRSTDGQRQIKKTVCKGNHNHPISSERWPGDGSATLDAIPVGQIEILQAAGVIRSSVAMNMSEEGEQEQPSGSSDSEEDDDSEPRVDAVAAAGDANAIERHVPAAPAQGTIVQTTTEVDVWGNGCQRRRNYHQSVKGRSKSKVWEEFTAVFSGGKIQRAECKHCKKCLSGKSSGGTSHLRRHLKICPAKCRTTRVKQKWSSSRLDSSVTNNWKFDQETSLELLTRALVSNLCPFSVTSSANFRKFLTGICPAYSIAPQAAIEEKFLSIFQNEKMKLKEEIALTPGGVFLSVKRWALECKYFVCFTVHFIDKEWKMHRKIIRCDCSGDEANEAEHYLSILSNWKCYLNIKSADIIGTQRTSHALIKEAVQDWNLGQKLLGIALPGNSGNEAILDLEETMAGSGQNYLLAKYKLLTVPCMIDALHDLFGFSLEHFILETSREWFEYMTCSALRLEKYKEILSRLHLNRPSFGSQRWHLTFYLFEAALQFIEAFPNPEEMDLKMYPRKPSPQRLEATKNFCDLARSIYHAVDVLSRQNVTFNSHFRVISSLGKALNESSRKINIKSIVDIDDMKKKFDNLWRKCYLWMSLAVFLDPRFKLRYVEHCFKQAFGTGAKLCILEVRGKIYELFLQYSCNVDKHSGELLNQWNNDLQMDRHDNDSLHGTDQIDIGQSVLGEFRELTSYLEGELYPRNDKFDILKWWKDNAATYPTLARLARDILAIPGSAVSAESAFDESDERVSLFNRKLSPEIVEALICTQDWIKSS
ncbi:hypothetical protein E2562_000523, partial [Oryza meyeriana var. granulata]